MGANSHIEFLTYTGDQYEGTLYNTVLTADFAISDLSNLPASWINPYYQIIPYIIAQNEDVLAWYCWSPDNPLALQPGNYYVPAWRFYNIPQGGSFSRLLQFTVDGSGLPPSDPRFDPIVLSAALHEDIFLNRTMSLKISEWLETLSLDIGTP